MTVEASACVGTGALCCDQAAKRLVLASANSGKLHPVLVSRPLLASRMPTAFFAAAWVLAAAALLALTVVPGLGSPRLGFALALGGAAGNLIDRLRLGAVIDFIEVFRWPAFNLADVAIVAGVFLALGSI
ncbi:MAG: hypothetical protein NVS1B9_01110 [Solirubrobacteraceae bacterium]